MGKNWIKKIRTIAAVLTWSLFLAAVGVGSGAFNREKRQIIQVIQIEKPKVALTFDDGPNKKYTPALLNELGKRGIHASFFLTIRYLRKDPPLRIQIEFLEVRSHVFLDVLDDVDVIDVFRCFRLQR